MNRTELQQIARKRIREANILLRNGEYSGAYYLSGYCIEFTLKACIAKKTQRHDFPDKDFVNKSYVHNLEQLVGVAGLKKPLEDLAKNNSNFGTNWSTVKDWNEKSRYEIKTEIQARDLYEAITNRTNGIFQWLRQHW